MLEKLILSNDIKYRICKHLIYWVFVYVYFSFPGITHGMLPFCLKKNLIYISIDILIVYNIIYFILPNYINNKRYAQFIFIYFLILIVNFIIKYSFYKFVEPHVFSSSISQINSVNLDFKFSILVLNDWHIATSHYLIVTLPPILSTTFKNWYFSQLEIKDLEKQSLELKMNTLRNQLHPHFLFNTLNNLYSLAIDKSEKAPEIIIKISDILRYMLKEHNHKIVNLEEELEIIRIYIELEQLRFEDNKVQVLIKDEIPCEIKNKINGPPLMLFTFVENAFKHGPNKSINSSWINILIRLENNVFYFIVENSKELNEKAELNNNTGLGLLNAKSTLYLYFKDNYQLEIISKPDSYKTILKISYDDKNKMFNC